MVHPDSTPDHVRYAASVGSVVVLVLGALLLHRTLHSSSDSSGLSLWSIALAATWTLGAVVLFAIAPSASYRTSCRERSVASRRPLIFAVTVGVAFAVVNVIGALVIRRIPVLGDDVAMTMGRVEDGPVLVLVVALCAGAAEELFFRIGLFRILPPRWAPSISTLLYGAVTFASGNLPLTLAAVLLGATCSFVLTSTARWYPPVIVHGLWTITMVGIFPQI